MCCALQANTCLGLSPEPSSFVNCPRCTLCPPAILQLCVSIILCSFKRFNVLALWEQVSTGIRWFPKLNELLILQAQVFDSTNLLFGASELFHHHCPSHACWDILGTDRQTSYLIQRLSQSLMYEKERILNVLFRINDTRE